MPTITPILTLDVRGVADLQEKLTGKRPAGATIRSYHSRGLMPPQVGTGPLGRGRHPRLVTTTPNSPIRHHHESHLRTADHGGPSCGHRKQPGSH